MNNCVLVGMLDGFTHLAEQQHAFSDGSAAAQAPGHQRLTFHVLHDEAGVCRRGKLRTRRAVR